jgi:GT2 family glycosyltransferase
MLINEKKNNLGPNYASVSVIIPTKDRPDDLEVAVRSLLRQSVLPRELIIVDQSRDAKSRQRVEREFAGSPPQLRHHTKLVYLHDTSIRGGAIARNRAMDAAQGDLWVFLDDDVELEPDFIQELLDTYHRYPQVDGVSGIITNYPLPPWPFRIWSWTFIRGPFRDERQPIYWNADLLRGSDPVAVSRLGGGVMSFRAAPIRGLRFDENLQGVSDGEDVDFCARLRPGAVLLIAPRARLVHHQSPMGRSKTHALRRFSRANCYLYQKHWRKGTFHRLFFMWLCVGLGLAASIASLRRGSLDPWRALAQGMREGTQVCKSKSDV